MGFDLGTDAWVVIRGGDAIVGYGQAMREEPTVVESWGSCTRAPGPGPVAVHALHALLESVEQVLHEFLLVVAVVHGASRMAG